MIKAVGITFPHSLKIYDLADGDIKVKPRDFVVVDIGQGPELGRVIYVGKEVKEATEEPLKKITRMATEEDMKRSGELEESSKEYLPLLSEKIKKYGLKMNPVGVSQSMDQTKVIFYFTAEGRVDFRELAKDLSRNIQKQAIMRQIGPRDEAKLIGGYGRCGQPVCCATFLTATESVTMETVEKQYGMPKNANKVSGICGRLMCCLNYELPEEKRINKRK